MSLVLAGRADRDDFQLDVHLQLDDGERLVLVGPNGAGKSSLLRVIAGLQPLTSGSLVADGETLDEPEARRWVAPEHRRIGTLFQDALLFPKLTVGENVAFGLRCRGADRRTARRRATRALERFGIEQLADRRPPSLSGGQAQRVALARTLVTEPRLLLLDEPYTALDTTSRAELRHQLGQLETARIAVTHDPIDALMLADRVAVIEQGRIVQTGHPDEVAARPATAWVADLLGINVVAGQAAGNEVTLDSGARAIAADRLVGPVFVTFAPNAVVLHRREPRGSARNVWPITITALAADRARVKVSFEGPLRGTAEVTPGAVAELELRPGEPAWASVKATELTVLPA